MLNIEAHYHHHASCTGPFLSKILICSQKLLPHYVVTPAVPHFKGQFWNFYYALVKDKDLSLVTITAGVEPRDYEEALKEDVSL